VKLLYFAAVRELLGKSEEDLELPDDVERLSQLISFLERERGLAGKLGGVRFAINESFAEPGDAIQANDVVAVIPPVAGG
jgi:molybdopterin converting factor subunit 1